MYKKHETVEEADRNNLYFAPRHVNPVLYTPVIVRKFESYRRRLRRVQSDLRSHIRPLHFKVIDPVTGRSHGRDGAQVKRKSVVPHYKKWAEHKKDNDPFVAALCEILAAMEPTRSGNWRLQKSKNILRNLGVNIRGCGVSFLTKSVTLVLVRENIYIKYCTSPSTLNTIIMVD